MNFVVSFWGFKGTKNKGEDRGLGRQTSSSCSNKILWDMDECTHSTLDVVHTLGQVQAHIYAQILHECILPSSPIGRANKETTSR